jgi:hypothetical protein
MVFLLQSGFSYLITFLVGKFFGIGFLFVGPSENYENTCQLSEGYEERTDYNSFKDQAAARNLGG